MLNGFWELTSQFYLCTLIERARAPGNTRLCSRLVKRNGTESPMRQPPAWPTILRLLPQRLHQLQHQPRQHQRHLHVLPQHPQKLRPAHLRRLIRRANYLSQHSFQENKANTNLPPAACIAGRNGKKREDASWRRIFVIHACVACQLLVWLLVTSCWWL